MLDTVYGSQNTGCKSCDRIFSDTLQIDDKFFWKKIFALFYGQGSTVQPLQRSDRILSLADISKCRFQFVA